MKSIQRCIFPSIDICSEEKLYFEIKGRGFFSFPQKKILVKRSSRILFDTYYNGLSLSIIKKHTIIKDVFLKIDIKGDALIKIGLRQIGKPFKWLLEDEINSKKQMLKIDEDFLAGLNEGILFFEVDAISDLEFKGYEWQTDIEPSRNVKMAVVITHFNRLNYVLPTIERLKNEVLDENIELIVVDNSRNINISNSDHVTIVKNKNYGGSGGFTRGLLEAKKKEFTHCLFMDDDASCETESIYRTFMLFSYAKFENIAVAGSLLRELEPYRLFEKGAKFTDFCRPICSGLDMRKFNDILLAEQSSEKVDYGGWWFFGFKIEEVKHYPFPFFVRGDDIMFGMINKFKILTPIGVACWGEDFSYKSSPLNIYLDVRNHIVQKLTHMDENFIHIFKMVLHFFGNAVFSYNYSTAKSVVKAIKDIENDYRKNDDYWIENIDTKKIRSDISNFKPSEKMGNIDTEASPSVDYRNGESNFRRTIRMMSLNGYLIPKFLLKNKTVVQQKHFRAIFRNIFRYKKVLYYYEPAKIGYIAKHSKMEFANCLITFIYVSIVFLIRFKKIKKKQNRNVSNYTSMEFWENLYKIPI